MTMHRGHLSGSKGEVPNAYLFVLVYHLRPNVRIYQAQISVHVHGACLLLSNLAMGIHTRQQQHADKGHPLLHR
eukprot:CAMPEP_0173205948 /NCGR_PEP_ID=MMETSP1141-20130122/21047_1 /TAXON_ID=483371 /ORGANISM="non described non described, Strain CCMP2298" /LENGTH=73 /DNA_ID=CAMNT_0014131951 /DNA_START=428 /DNA_END=645 /DNA_ORIENTATION=-